MATIHGVAGEWARVKGTVVGLWPLFLGVFAIGFSVAMFAFLSMLWGAILLVSSMAYTGWSLAAGVRHVESFFKGARGEELVSGILRRLPDRYHVFNDFIAEGVHVDHVVVGPAGVFAVETKNWRAPVTIEDGCILADGCLPSRPPLTQVLREAALVKSTLARAGWIGDVTPVLAFASDTFRAGRAELNGAVILNANELLGAFETNRVVLPYGDLERLVGLMENIA